MNTYHIYKRIVRHAEDRTYESLVPHMVNGRKVTTNDPHNYVRCSSRSGTFIFIPDDAILSLTVEVEWSYNAEITDQTVGLS